MRKKKDHIIVRRAVADKGFTLVYCVTCKKWWSEPHRALKFTGGRGIRPYLISKESRAHPKSFSGIKQENEIAELVKLLQSEEYENALDWAHTKDGRGELSEISPKEKRWKCERCNKPTGEEWMCHSCGKMVCWRCWSEKKEKCVDCSL